MVLAAAATALLASFLVFGCVEKTEDAYDGNPEGGGPTAIAEGGEVTLLSDEMSGQVIEIHTFLESGEFIVQDGVEITADILIVAGGGGGGGSSYNHGGGGGGAGGFVEHSGALTAGTYTVTVGQGGAGGAGNSEDAVYMESVDKLNTKSGSNGEDSVFGNITAYGGGGGGAHYTGANADTNGKNGGSGGGAGFAGGGREGIGVPGQGNNGGAGASNSSGGGGGAGSAAIAAVSGTSSAGGNGKVSYISGEAVWYAGGGAGGLAVSDTAIVLGGDGGGGSSHSAGFDGTGGGGGGGSGKAPTGEADNIANRKGAKGGSGIVIIRFLHPEAQSETEIDE